MSSLGKRERNKRNNAPRLGKQQRINSAPNTFLTKFKHKFHKKDELKDKFITTLVDQCGLKKADIERKSKIYLYKYLNRCKEENESIKGHEQILELLKTEMKDLLPELHIMKEISPDYAKIIDPIIVDITRVEEQIKLVKPETKKKEEWDEYLINLITTCNTIIEREIERETQITKLERNSKKNTNTNKQARIMKELEGHRLAKQQQQQQLQQLQQLHISKMGQSGIIPQTQMAIHPPPPVQYVLPSGGGKKSPKRTTKKKSTTTRKKKTSTPKKHKGPRGGIYIIRKGRKIYQ